ncbi:4-hydroxyphenylpyruvate dioxygenase [Scytonema hofmannii FACHB-248]|uniref:4-hydroxyphenylpyruvate dioxygenase n=1 Tax=Scytonema hofmannii FACHB-248 TaxID=1842502 RepID=A0ABR8GYX8_9CYAN|nr:MULTISPECIES: 4-hydroxyphenylpyruvate dioxygenase [Nostocales]MBD2608335.1 4-hydroxyphenylpyruvate dioxygenase [Scytonema hofmannii FACHB-248]
MKIAHVHFYVEDALVWQDWFVSHLGFQAVTDYMIPLTLTNGLFHTCTKVVKSGAVCFLLSSPLLPTSPVAEFLRQHPPGVADVAFDVENVEKAIALAAQHNAEVLQPIQQYQQSQEYIKWGKISAWGSLTHTLIERGRLGDKGTTWGQGRQGGISSTSPSLPLPPSPSFPTSPHSPLPPSSITAIDHIVLNVPAGDLERAVAWYEEVLDFEPQQAFKIKTDRSALHSRVMLSRNGGVQLPINEPASAHSQIQEFLDVNRGAGIQHIALQTPNIVNAIALFRACGLSLLPVPPTYYSQLKQREKLPLSALELEAIARHEILVDWKEDTQKAVLLQIFTQPIFGQPTFFFEFIERRFQAQGFGEGNFRALFEAIEKEQIKRGSLN